MVMTICMVSMENDILDGGLGDDLIDGGSGKDTLIFGNQDTTVSLAADQDGVAQDTGHGSDTIMTTTIENVTSGSGNDSITGNVHDNILDGGAGNDTLVGSYGDDELIGGFGDDTLTGGFGDDTLTGGSGNDTFVFGEIFGDDTITDFNISYGRFLKNMEGAQVTVLSSNNLELIIADADGIVQGSLTLENISISDWNTNAIEIEAYEPTYTFFENIDGYSIYQDNETDEVVTDTGGSNSSKVIITNSTGTLFRSCTQLLRLSK